jgi:hypothetical protein
MFIKLRNHLKTASKKLKAATKAIKFATMFKIIVTTPIAPVQSASNKLFESLNNIFILRLFYLNFFIYDFGKFLILSQSAFVFFVSGYISFAIDNAAGADITLATNKWFDGTPKPM